MIENGPNFELNINKILFCNKIAEKEQAEDTETCADLRPFTV